MSPRKVRLVLELVRGKYVDEAAAILRATPNRAAQVVGKLVKSAASNAEANLGVPRDSLKVSGCFADAGPTLKRIHPRAMGRAYRIIKRTSHITVMVEETEPKPSTRKLARTVGRGEAKGRRQGKPEAAEKPARGAKAVPAEPKEEVKEEAAGQTAAVEEEAPQAAESTPEASEAPAAEEQGAEASEETGGDEPAQKGDE
jgi:large subunit ribosomal protein L22